MILHYIKLHYITLHYITSHTYETLQSAPTSDVSQPAYLRVLQDAKVLQLRTLALTVACRKDGHTFHAKKIIH